jgi:WD40 repeat protein
LSLDGRRAISADGRILKVWDWASGTALRTWSERDFRGDFSKPAMSGNGRCCVMAWSWFYFLRGHRTGVKMWDLTTGRILRVRSERVLADAADVTEMVSISEDGRRAISSPYKGGTLKVWDLRVGRKLPHALTTGDDRIDCVAISGNGRRAVSISGKGVLRVWDLETGIVLNSLDEQSLGEVEGSYRKIALSRDGRRAVTAYSHDDVLKVWDLDAGRVVRLIQTGASGNRDVALRAAMRSRISRCPKKNGSSVTPQNTDRLAGTRSAHRRLCRLFNLRGVATGSSRPDRRPRCRVSFGARPAGRADGHAPLSLGAAAWIASAWTPPSSSPTSVSLIMRWRSSRLFPRNTSATIYTLK